MSCVCFPSSTRVTTKVEGVKRIDQLSWSDEVLTLRRKFTPGGTTAGSVTKWTKFYTWGHYDPNRSEDFIVLKFLSGQELEISADHMLFIVGDNGRVPKRAGDVCTGDKLYHLGGTGALEELSVTEITVQNHVGVFSPFTTSGDFFANGFLVACYANISDFHKAHAAFAPLRLWCKVKKPSHNVKEGIHGYAVKLQKFRNLFPISLQKRINII